MHLRLPLLLALGCAAALRAEVRPFTIDTVMEDLRATHPQATRVTDELPPGVEARENLTYSRPGGVALQLDVYRPAGSGPRPAVLIVHGGGWLTGDRTMERPFARQLALRGYVAIPVSYRLGTRGRFPAPVHDLKAAVRWLRAHAAEHGIDPAHIGVAGGSAGGTLAVLLGATNGMSEMEGTGGEPGQSSRVQAVADIDGSVTFMDNALIQSSENRPAHPYWEFVHGPFRANRAVWVAASPLCYTGSDSAPTLFLKSTVTQPILAGRDEMSARLRILGIDSPVIVYPDTPHPFWLVHPWFERVVNDVDIFFRRHLLTP